MATRILEFLKRHRPGPSIESWAPTAIAAGAVVLFISENLWIHFPIDDAFIFYRYARNLANGHGFVYNVGEHVEGVTSLLWTLLLAIGTKAGGNPVNLGHWLGVASGAALLWLTYRYAAFGLTGRARAVAALSAWLLVLSTPFALWSTSGLETPLFGLVVVAALLAEARGNSVLTAVASAVAVLTRPEGVFLAPILFGFLLWKRAAERKKTIVMAATYGAFLVLLTAFRLAYFGSPLPNTFYAKVGGSMPWWGVYYVGVFGLQTLLPMLWPAVCARREAYLWPGACWVVCVFVDVLAVGGDAFHHSRFFVPALPILCALVIRGAILSRGRANAPARFAISSVAVCAVWFALGTAWGLATLAAAILEIWSRNRGRIRRTIAACGLVPVVLGARALARYVEPEMMDEPGELVAHDRSLGLVLQPITISARWAEVREARTAWRYLAVFGRNTAKLTNARIPSDKLIATLGIGAFGYYSRAKILDIVGLVDPVVARSKRTSERGLNMAFPGHQRTNAAYILSRDPECVLIPRRNTGLYRPPAVLDLWGSRTFHKRYTWDEEVAGYCRKQ